jgi:UDP-2,3-diacylglucosamine pyrophosphatase LpxH
MSAADPHPRPFQRPQRLSRRAFLHGGALVMLQAGLGPGRLPAAEPAGSPSLRIGLVTDLHYADREPGGTRHYRDTLGKLRTAVDHFNRAKADMLMEVGDLIDAAETVEGEIAHLDRIEAELARFPRDRHYVLGNHCVWTLSKRQFREHSRARAEHYSFDHGGIHFVVLDACHRADGVAYGNRNFTWTDTEIPPGQRDWLKADLAKASGPVMVFVHQRLDVKPSYAVKSAAEVRALLEQSGKVLAVFQGHSHKNDYQEIRGIHYCTLAAMVEGAGEENNAYGLLQVFADGTLKIEGFRQQKSRDFPRATPA